MLGQALHMPGQATLGQALHMPGQATLGKARPCQERPGHARQGEALHYIKILAVLFRLN